MLMLTWSKVVTGEVIDLRGEPIDTVLLNGHFVKLLNIYVCILYLSCVPTYYFSLLRQP